MLQFYDALGECINNHGRAQGILINLYESIPKPMKSQLEEQEGEIHIRKLNPNLFYQYIISKCKKYLL